MDELASEFDTAWKEALEWFFEPFLAFFFRPVFDGIDWFRGHEFLDKELQQLVPEVAAGRETVDKLAKVWTLAGEEEWVLVHVEVQSQHDAGFAARMYRYNCRLLDKHGRMPVSLAVLGDESPTWRPEAHSEGRWGCEVQVKFPMVKLVDYKGRDAKLEANNNPFAAVVLAHRKAQETKSDFDKRYNWKLRLVRGLLDRGFNTVQIHRLFRVIDWVIKLPKVQHEHFKQEIRKLEQEKQVPLLSPTQQYAYDQSKAEGRMDGIEAILSLRFGAEGLALMPLIRKITDPDIIGPLLQASQTADLDAFRAMLPQQPQA